MAAEIARVIELDRRLSHRVRAARGRGAFPLVLASNCNSCLGSVAGIGSHGLGVVWVDAHADFYTPEDNLSGFFDVMELSILAGTGWAALREAIPGFGPVAERPTGVPPWRRCSRPLRPITVSSPVPITRSGLSLSVPRPV